MSVADALSDIAECTILLKNLNRDLDDGFGFFSKPENNQATFTGTVLPVSLEELKASRDGSVGVDDLNVYVKCRIDIELNDTLEIEGITYTVKAARFRREGNYTKIRVRELTRRDVTN